MDEKPIYDFHKFRKCLEEKGFVISESKPYRPIKAGDVSLNGENIIGNVSLDENGMFVISDNGTNHNVFLIKKSFYFEYDGRISIPKAHLCMCEAIIQHGESAYRYANSQPVEVYDKGTNRNRMVGNLKLCGFCSNMLRGQFSNIHTINEFIEILKQSDESYNDDLIEEKDVNFAGYTRDWNMISLAYRAVHNYTCEKCGIKLDDFEGRLFCQTHHKNGKKTDNRTNNLQCLCVKCHSQIDDTHRKNFSTKTQQILLRQFDEYKKDKIGI